jgi:lipopolysaccharide export system permease protein
VRGNRPEVLRQIAWVKGFNDKGNEGVEGDAEIRSLLAAVGDHGDSRDIAAEAADDFDGLKDSTTAGDHILDNEDPFARVYFKTAAEGERTVHLLEKEVAGTGLAGDLLTDDQSPHRRSHHGRKAPEGNLFQHLGGEGADGFKVFAEQGTLEELPAVAPGAQDKVPVEERIALAEELKNGVVCFHRWTKAENRSITSISSQAPRLATAMRLLDRYFLKEVGTSTASALLLFVFVLLVGNVLRDLLGLLTAGRVTIGLFFQLLFLLVPYVVAYALPLGFLTGILLGLGRLSAQNEVLVCKSAGISLLRLSRPLLLLAVLGVGLTAAFNLLYGPSNRTAYKNMLVDVVRNNPLTFLQPGLFIQDFNGFVIHLRDREENRLKDLWIWQLNAQGQAQRLIRAREGVITLDEEADALLLSLKEGSVEERGARGDAESFQNSPLRTVRFAEFPIRLELGSGVGVGFVPRKLSQMTLPQLLAEKQRILDDPDIPAADRFPQWIEVSVVLQKHLVLATGLLPLCLIAVPLSIKVGRKETYANVSIALLLGFGFYFCVIAMSWFEARPEWRPDILIWLPNLAFTALGALLFWRQQRT